MTKYALVTGASSGIGKEMAKILKSYGYNLILVARRKDRLKEVSNYIGGDNVILPIDLSKEKELYRLVGTINEYNLEVFINCAGFGDCGAFVETDLDKELQMIDVNIRAVHILTKEILKNFSKENKGYILNVASSAGLLPGGPYMATYYATKAYVCSLTRAISKELKDKGLDNVYVGVLCPGPVDTEFNKVAGVKFALKGISAISCARAAINGMLKRKTLIVPTFTMKAGIFFSKFVTGNVLLKIISKQQRKKIYK